ncbi:hypothetical protein GCM10023238_16510 [Streptomyces heliomycini]
MLALGARVLDREDSESKGFRVYADPAGHPFCLCGSNSPSRPARWPRPPSTAGGGGRAHRDGGGSGAGVRFADVLVRLRGVRTVLETGRHGLRTHALGGTVGVARSARRFPVPGARPPPAALQPSSDSSVAWDGAPGLLEAPGHVLRGAQHPYAFFR